jgi:hypothetical protein
MTLHEPATLVTDYLLAGLATWLALRLGKVDRPAGPARRWFGRALALTAISAFVGGSYHGFAPNFGPDIATAWWWLTLLVIHLLSAAMGLSWAHELLPLRWHRTAQFVIAARLAGFALASALQPRFVMAIADYGSTLLLWLVTAAFTRRPWRAPMLLAIGLSGIAAAVQQLRLAPAPAFNHNDLYHVIQAFALYAFYRAALRLDAKTRAHPAVGDISPQ